MGSQELCCDLADCYPAASQLNYPINQFSINVISGMKSLALLACIFTLLSCEEKHAAPQSSPQPNVIRDSNLIKKEADNPYVAVDISPMDMLYFPTDYPVKKMNGETKDLPVVRVIYSRPHRAGRHLFGGLVQWGQPWRLGANEATEIEFFQPVTIQAKRIESGTYLMYAIPFENRWALVLNKNLYAWGLKFNPADDVVKFEVPSTKTPQLIEHFTMTFEKAAGGADLLMAWENTEVRLPIQF